MTNFIFKSPSDLQKIRQQLKTILDNQRHLRSDISSVNLQVSKIYNALALQKQVDEYFEKGEEHGIPDTRDED